MRARSVVALKEERTDQRQTEEEEQPGLALHLERGVRRSLSFLPDSWVEYLSGEELVPGLQEKAHIWGHVVLNFSGLKCVCRQPSEHVR